MAATIARATGFNKEGERRTTEATRLGHGAAQGCANTWRTFTTAYIEADGHGYVDVVRDGKTIHHFAFDAEGPR